MSSTASPSIAATATNTRPAKIARRHARPSVFSAEHNREAILLGRPLTANEALEFTKPVRRIAALLALHPLLDAHYEATTDATA